MHTKTTMASLIFLFIWVLSLPLEAQAEDQMQAGEVAAIVNSLRNSAKGTASEKEVGLILEQIASSRNREEVQRMMKLALTLARQTPGASAVALSLKEAANGGPAEKTVGLIVEKINEADSREDVLTLMQVALCLINNPKDTSAVVEKLQRAAERKGVKDDISTTLNEIRSENDLGKILEFYNRALTDIYPLNRENASTACPQCSAARVYSCSRDYRAVPIVNTISSHGTINPSYIVTKVKWLKATAKGGNAEEEINLIAETLLDARYVEEVVALEQLALAVIKDPTPATISDNLVKAAKGCLNKERAIPVCAAIKACSRKKVPGRMKEALDLMYRAPPLWIAPEGWPTMTEFLLISGEAPRWVPEMRGNTINTPSGTCGALSTRELLKLSNKHIDRLVEIKDKRFRDSDTSYTALKDETRTSLIYNFEVSPADETRLKDAGYSESEIQDIKNKARFALPQGKKPPTTKKPNTKTIRSPEFPENYLKGGNFDCMVSWELYAVAETQDSLEGENRFKLALVNQASHPVRITGVWLYHTEKVYSFRKDKEISSPYYDGIAPCEKNIDDYCLGSLLTRWMKSTVRSRLGGQQEHSFLKYGVLCPHPDNLDNTHWENVGSISSGAFGRWESVQHKDDRFVGESSSYRNLDGTKQRPGPVAYKAGQGITTHAYEAYIDTETHVITYPYNTLKFFLGFTFSYRDNDGILHEGTCRSKRSIEISRPGNKGNVSFVLDGTDYETSLHFENDWTTDSGAYLDWSERHGEKTDGYACIDDFGYGEFSVFFNKAEAPSRCLTIGKFKVLDRDLNKMVLPLGHRKLDDRTSDSKACLTAEQGCLFISAAREAVILKKRGLLMSGTFEVQVDNKPVTGNFTDVFFVLEDDRADKIQVVDPPEVDLKLVDGNIEKKSQGISWDRTRNGYRLSSLPYQLKRTATLEVGLSSPWKSDVHVMLMGNVKLKGHLTDKTVFEWNLVESERGRKPACYNWIKQNNGNLPVRRCVTIPSGETSATFTLALPFEYNDYSKTQDAGTAEIVIGIDSVQYGDFALSTECCDSVDDFLSICQGEGSCRAFLEIPDTPVEMPKPPAVVRPAPPKPQYRPPVVTLREDKRIPAKKKSYFNVKLNGRTYRLNEKRTIITDAYSGSDVQFVEVDLLPAGGSKEFMNLQIGFRHQWRNGTHPFWKGKGDQYQGGLCVEWWGQPGKRSKYCRTGDRWNKRWSGTVTFRRSNMRKCKIVDTDCCYDLSGRFEASCDGKMPNPSNIGERADPCKIKGEFFIRNVRMESWRMGKKGWHGGMRCGN